MATLKPLSDRVLVKAVEQKEVEVGGIFLPDTAQDKPQESIIVALGTGGIDTDGNKIIFHVKEGDTVLTSKYGGTDVKVDGNSVLITSK